jgi:hypothetical protein
MEVSVTSIPESLPDSGDLGGLCPRCGRIAAFELQGGDVALKPNGSERAIVVKCMGCGDSVVVVERRTVVLPDGRGVAYEGIHWWPFAGLGDLDPDVPVHVCSAYSEGMRALSVKAARAAVVMFRGMLAQVVADKGSTTAQAKNTLYAKLEQMSQEGSLHPSLVEWAQEIRLIGNAAAHPDALDPVSDEEAADLARLCRQLLSFIYEVPARIARNRAARGPTP